MAKVVSAITVYKLIRVVMMVKVVRLFRELRWSKWSRWSGWSGWSTTPQGEMAVLALVLAEKGPHIVPSLPGEARVRSILPTARHKGLVDYREGVAASSFESQS